MLTLELSKIGLMQLAGILPRMLSCNFVSLQLIKNYLTIFSLKMIFNTLKLQFSRSKLDSILILMRTPTEAVLSNMTKILIK